MTISTDATGTRHRQLSWNHRKLNDADRQQVLEFTEQRGTECPVCRERFFGVGDALEMGSIWPDEELGTYMIALTCRSCGSRTGIRLHWPGVAG